MMLNVIIKESVIIIDPSKSPKSIVFNRLHRRNLTDQVARND